jgi:lysozyme
MPADLYKVIADLERDEGFSSSPYKDTVGKLTIGFGRNLTDVGISKDEARALLRNDIEIAIKELNARLDYWDILPETVQRALINMAFNMGISRLMLFGRMFAAIENGLWMEAAKEALDSKWARQVGVRSQRVAALFREGVSSASSS